MHVFPLTRQGGRLTLLRNSDHLLRRFGQLELLDLAAGQRSALPVRGEADRFLYSISGAVNALLLDVRPTSPSHGAQASMTLTSDDPRGLLVPFGVACSLEAISRVMVIQLSTHSESHPSDRALNAEEQNLIIG